MEDPQARIDVVAGEDRPHDGGSAVGRPWVGIRFECCAVYARIYRNAARTAYQGRCPKCLRPITLQIGPGGTDARFFQAE